MLIFHWKNWKKFWLVQEKEAQKFEYYVVINWEGNFELVEIHFDLILSECKITAYI